MIDSLGPMVEAFNTRVKHIESITHNLANTHTPGFKAERLYLKMTDQEQPGGLLYVPALDIDFTPGDIFRTGNPLDMAIQADGFFVIETDSGEAYTRKGNFVVNGANELMTPEGAYVMGEGGRIVLTGKQIVVSDKGEIESEEGAIGKLRIVRFDKPDELVREGSGVYRDPEGKAGRKPQGEPGIKSQHLENSNVQVLKEMVQMINAQRLVESYQKIIQTLSDFDRLSTGRIGRLM